MTTTLTLDGAVRIMRQNRQTGRSKADRTYREQQDFDAARATINAATESEVTAAYRRTAVEDGYSERG